MNEFTRTPNLKLITQNQLKAIKDFVQYASEDKEDLELYEAIYYDYMSRVDIV